MILWIWIRFGTSVWSDICRKKDEQPRKFILIMVSTLGNDATALSTVKKWTAKFKRGRESLEDDSRSGRPSTAITQENIDCIHQMVMNDRRLTISHSANVINISYEWVENILHNKLSMSKVLARWVLWLLTPDQKLTGLVMLKANLARFEADPDHFVERFLTQDECWVHHFEPESKRQSMKWKHSISLAPKAKLQNLSSTTF